LPDSALATAPGLVAVVEYVISSAWLGRGDTVRLLGNPAIDFFAMTERNWSNSSGAAYTHYRAGIFFKNGWRF
jgi:hypothetical protein